MTQLSQLEMDLSTGLAYNSLIQSSPESEMGQMLKRRICWQAQIQDLG